MCPKMPRKLFLSYLSWFQNCSTYCDKLMSFVPTDNSLSAILLQIIVAVLLSVGISNCFTACLFPTKLTDSHVMLVSLLIIESWCH